MKIRLSALFGLLAVLLGASGSHGRLHDQLLATGELDHWRTAVQYHLIHAVLAFSVALACHTGGKRVLWAWRMLIAGILLFSGSLYALALTQIKTLGAITPLGGLSFIIGWLLLALARWSQPSVSPP